MKRAIAVIAAQGQLPEDQVEPMKASLRGAAERLSV